MRKRGYERTYVNKYDGSLIFGQIDIKKGVVYLQDGQVFHSEKILEYYTVKVTEKETVKYKTVPSFRYDPVLGKKTYATKKVRA